MTEKCTFEESGKFKFKSPARTMYVGPSSVPASKGSRSKERSVAHEQSGRQRLTAERPTHLKRFDSRLVRRRFATSSAVKLRDLKISCDLESARDRFQLISMKMCRCASVVRCPRFFAFASHNGEPVLSLNCCWLSSFSQSFC